MTTPAPAPLSALARARAYCSSSLRGSLALNGPDKLFLGYLALLLVAGLGLPDLVADKCGAFALAVALIGAARLSRSSRVARIIHDFDPILGVIAAFSLAGPLAAQINRARWDVALAALDRRWFGALVVAWRGALGRPDWLTDLASLGYLSFYVVPVALMLALYQREDRRLFAELVEVAVAAFVALWVLYAVVPAAGPRVAPDVADAVLGGGFISRATRAFLRHVEYYELDAFPSGHTALSVIYAVVGGLAIPRWRIPLLLIAALTVFSTVYLSMHYVVDVVAGLAFAAVVLTVRLAWPTPATQDLRSPSR